MMVDDMPRERITITMEPELLERVRRLATLEESNVSAVIERFVGQLIGDAEFAASAMRDPLVGQVIDELFTPEKLARAARIVSKESDDPQEFRERVLRLLNRNQTSGGR